MAHIPPILLVHGMYLNAHSWKPWIARATQRGLVASAVSWPFHQGDPEERREHIDPRLGRLTFGAVVASLKAHIEELPEHPILIGHSIGGLVVQKLRTTDTAVRASRSVRRRPWVCSHWLRSSSRPTGRTSIRSLVTARSS